MMYNDFCPLTHPCAVLCLHGTERKNVRVCTVHVDKWHSYTSFPLNNNLKFFRFSFVVQPLASVCVRVVVFDGGNPVASASGSQRFFAVNWKITRKIFFGKCRIVRKSIARLGRNALNELHEERHFCKQLRA